jgi:hypothetical protein
MCWKLCPSMFGVPQFRERLWLPALPSSTLEQSGMSLSEARAFMSGVMNALVGGERQSLEAYLLAEQDPLVQDYYRVCTASASGGVSAGWDGMVTCVAAPPQTRTKILSWPEPHAKLLRNDAYWMHFLPDESILRHFPGLHDILEREFEVLRIKGVRTFPEPTPRVLEISQSASRQGGPVTGATSVITPSGRKYISSRCRILLGLEGLRMQSIFYSPSQEKTVREFSNSFLSDLAGNAMEGSCCAATLLCVFAFLAQTVDSCGVPPILEEMCHSDSEGSDDDVLDIWGRARLDSLAASDIWL